jgi:hypothetical protein
MSITALSSVQLRRAAEIKDEIVNLQYQLNQLLGETTVPELVVKKRRTMSATGRKRVAAAQKARWAKLKSKKK